MSTDDAAPALFCQTSLDELEQCLGKETLWKLLDGFPKECLHLLEELQAALACDNLADTRKIAHNIKGMAANYAATAIADIARELELDDLSLAQSKHRAAELGETIVQTQAWIAKSA